jgi:hypothetical protein
MVAEVHGKCLRVGFEVLRGALDAASLNVEFGDAEVEVSKKFPRGLRA